jgi:hypothetical protein
MRLEKPMKIFYFTLLVTLMACQDNGQTKNTSKINPMNDSLAKTLNVDVEVINAIKKHTDANITQAILEEDAEFGFKDSTVFEAFKLKNIGGVSFDIKSEGSIEVVRNLQNDLFSKGYIVYTAGHNFRTSLDRITILKTTDQMDALRFQGTNGVNYDIFCEDIIHNLQQYDAKYGLVIEGASLDYVQAHLKKMPDDLSGFAKEIYTFCPDVVDQGTGTVEELEQEIKNTQTLYYWWD